MTASANSLPLPIRLFNIAGRGANTLGMKPISLQADKLLATARDNTGLDDFGDDSFRKPFAMLLDSLEEEGQLTLFGRVMARGDILRLLHNRLAIVDTLKRNPEIEQQPITQPLVVVGPPRTGTTIFHDLLAQDASMRVPLSWEAAYPCPPPEAATYRSDPRIAKVQSDLDQVDKLLPEFKKMHPMGADHPQECVSITAHDFTSMMFDTQFRVPSYEGWMNEADVSSAFHFHRKFLQLLQWKTPAERWALKSPQHLWHLGALLDEYPDARIVQTHRDPLRVLVSVSSLIATLRSLGSEAVDLQEIARLYADWLARGFNHTVALRKSGRLPTEQVIDMQFSDFIQDQVGCVRRAYEHFGWQLSPAATTSMQHFLDNHPADKHGRHLYSFADIGMDLEEVGELFRPYREYFGIKTEPV